MISTEDINAELVKFYIEESIEHYRAGKKIPNAAPRKLNMPPRLQTALAGDPGLKASFKTFRRAQQCDFADYISSVKQVATKQRRLEKIIPLIRSDIGLNDKYK